MTAPRTNASHDQNFVPSLIGVSTVDGTTPVPVEVDPVTGAMQVSGSGGGGGDASAANQTNGNQKTQVVDAGGEAVTVTGGKLDVNASVDTTGLATSAKQDTGNTSLASIDGKITAVNTGAVVVSSSALPSGAATSAAQTDKSQFTTDGTDTALITASGEQNVLATAQPGVDIGDVTINNASGGAAVNIQDGGNSITVDGAVTTSGTVTEANSGGILTSVQLIDDTVYTDDTSTHATGTSKGLGIMAAATPTDTSVNANDIGMVAMTTDRRLLVDASGVAVPVTDNSASLSVDWNGTQPVTGSGTATGALRVELPTNGTGVIATVGTITNAVTVNSHAVTNAGTFVVQENGAALTALQLIDDPVATLGTTTYTEATTKGNIIGAVRRDANTTLVDTTNEVAPLQVNATGELKVAQIQALPAGTNAIGKLAANDGVDVGDVTINNASGGSAVNIQDGGNSITVDYATTGSGTATGALRVELPTNGTGVIATVGAVTAITNALPAGTNAIGKLAANSGVDIGDIDVTSIIPGTGATNLGKAEDAVHTTGDVGVAILGIRDDTLNATSGTEGDYEMFHTTAEGAMWVTQAPSITNGWATFNATSGDGSTALTNTAQQVKATTGTVGGWYIYNPNATATYVNFYNSTSAGVTVGTTNQQMVICVPATAGANVEFGNGITFATAISISATTTGGGNTAPSTALECNVFYK